MSLSILDGKKSFDINGDKFRPGISISNSEVGLASLSIAAFILRLVCTNGLVSKTEISAAYRHVSTKILDEFPATMDKVSYELGAQKQKIGLSMESLVDKLNTISGLMQFFEQRRCISVQMGDGKPRASCLAEYAGCYFIFLNNPAVEAFSQIISPAVISRNYSSKNRS